MESTAPAMPAAPAPEQKDETGAGNYFVSNYPPFSCWETGRLSEVNAALDRAPQPGTPLGVYLHIPFCRKRCHFCYFRVYTGKDSTQIQAYIDGALQELERYSRRSFIGMRKPNFIYFGGGTPSYLSTDQLRHLTAGMKKRLPWDEAEEITFECEPGTLTEPKLKNIRDMGVTRLSLGVENFDPHILEVNGRAHKADEIYRAYGFASNLGFPQINIDLIAGMVEETESNWKRCVEETLKLAPDSVTIYQMEVPYNTTIYKEMKTAGKLTAPVADWPTKRGWVQYAFDELAKHGYTTGSAYTAVKDKQKTRFVYRDRLWAGADLLGLGVASFSHVGGVHFQNLPDFDPYIEVLNDPKNPGALPHWRAITPTPEERFIREWILQLKLGLVRPAYFQEKFGVNPRERFANELSALEQQGYFTLGTDEIRATRNGLLQIDRLLHTFFLPQHRQIRYT